MPRQRRRLTPLDLDWHEVMDMSPSPPRNVRGHMRNCFARQEGTVLRAPSGYQVPFWSPLALPSAPSFVAHHIASRMVSTEFLVRVVSS